MNCYFTCQKLSKFSKTCFNYYDERNCIGLAPFNLGNGLSAGEPAMHLDQPNLAIPPWVGTVTIPPCEYQQKLESKQKEISDAEGPTWLGKDFAILLVLKMFHSRWLGFRDSPRPTSNLQGGNGQDGGRERRKGSVWEDMGRRFVSLAYSGSVFTMSLFYRFGFQTCAVCGCWTKKTSRCWCDQDHASFGEKFWPFGETCRSRSTCQI